MNVHGRMPREASMEYFIKNKQTKTWKHIPSPASNTWCKSFKLREAAKFATWLKTAFNQELGVLHSEYQQLTGLWVSVNLDVCIFGHRYLNLNNLNLKQEHFRLQRKTTKVYRILNKYPSYGVMPLSRLSLRCRIPWVSRTGRGHTFLTSPVTPECIRYPKCVHRANCFLTGQNNPPSLSPVLQLLPCFQLHLRPRI